MNTKLLMMISAVIMGIIGAAFIFVPDEAASYGGFNSTNFSTIVLQILGSLYFAFAMLNWMAKANLIGGIYSRPDAIANFTHFFVGGLALIKGIFAVPNTIFVGIAAIIYAVFAVFFGLVLFTHPAGKKEIN